MFNKFIDFKSDINRKIGGGMPQKLKDKAEELGKLSKFKFLKDDHPYVLYKVCFGKNINSKNHEFRDLWTWNDKFTN